MASFPPAVRILPMSREEPEFVGKSAKEVQRDFFRRDFPARPLPGKYNFRKRGLSATPGTVVLFQYDNAIIASAIFRKTEFFDEPEEDQGVEYRGAIYFDADSIRDFEPVGPDQMKGIWPKFSRFSHAKTLLDPKGYPDFERATGLKQSPTPSAHDLEAPPASRVRTTAYRIVRDTQVTKRVKELHRYKCQICGETILLADGSRYAEGHHIKPLGAPHNGPDSMDNVICLCPNHHAICDFGAMRLVLITLRQISGHTMSQRYIDYHNRTICE